MSEEEKRALKGAALLEVEEAKADLALLRARAEQWKKHLEKVIALLSRMGRESEHLANAAKEMRGQIEGNIDILTRVITIAAVLALDTELEQAVKRFEKAEAAKKSLGFV